MNPFGTFLLLCTIAYITLSWLIPQILSWLFKRKFRLNVTIGRIVFPYLKLKDVYISRGGFKVHIDEIGFRSSFFSSEVTKLIALVVHDVRINKDVGARENKKYTNQSSSKDGIPDFHNCIISPMIITFAQFMAVHIYNVNTMLLGPESPEFLVHATAGEVHLDGSIVHNSRTLLVNITVAGASAKLLRHAIGDANTQTCLAELSFGISFEAILKAQGPLSVEKLILGMNHTIAVINEGFYGFAQERNQGKEITYHKYNKTSPSFKDLFYKIQPIIPKDLDIKIEDTFLTGTKNSHTDFNSTLKCFKFNSKFDFSSDKEYKNKAKLDLQLDYFDVRCNKEIALLLKIFTINGELEENDFNFNILLKTLAVNYNHKDIFNWIETHFKRPQNEYICQEMDSKFKKEITTGSTFPSWIIESMNRCILKISADLWNVSALIRLSDEPLGASAGFNHMKVSFNLFEKVDKNMEFENWFPIFLQQRQYGAECLIESLWCRLGNSSLAADSHLLKKFHAWGTPLFLGVFLVEIKNNKQNRIRVLAMVDTLHLEWSPALAKCIARGHKCISEYTDSLGHHTSIIKESSSKRSKINQLTSNCLFNFKLTNSNCFLIVDKNLCLVIRLDSATLERSCEEFTLNVSGAKMNSVLQDGSEYFCLKSDEIKNACGHIQQARCSYKYKTRESLIRLIDEIQFSWSTELHLTILALLEQFRDFYSSLIVHSPNYTKMDHNEKKDQQQLYILLKGRLGLDIKISTKHTLSVSLEDLSCAATPNHLSSLASSLCQIALDNHPMFTFTGLKVSRILEDKEVLLERDNSEGFQLPWNNTWQINLETFKAKFPYEHYFAEAFQNRFIALFKWLKLVHKRHHPSKVKPRSLPSDLVIVVKEFVFEMSDDPFEVRLRDNYELLEDEYKESLKRQQLLDAKVHEYSMKHLLPPAGKVDELYANLKKKNGEIYVQRSKQIQKSGPSRTRLFAWLMNDIKIMSLADPSINGAENVISVMTEIDPETPWPEEGLEFTTLWCRSVSARCREWKFQLRDFPQPWLDIENFHIWGRLVGAEQEATRRAKRAVKIEIGPPWNDDIIERSMTSLKLYHDFNCDIDRYSYAFGPCWEPVIAQCMLNFEKISSPSRDPSLPLPFWDKMRLLFHGRLTMCVAQMTVLLHASLDPYNTTEEMELTWTNLALDWTNAKVVLKGDLDVYVRTASKYDDCRLLHLPNLRLTIKLDWACLGNPNDHHSVMPCAPDKLPEYSSNQEHDSFRAFRSQNLNVSISLETKPIPAQGSPKEFDCPLALLYGSTLRWFENLKFILSGVTRPTKRGAVFNNLRPRKTQLSRHYKKVHLLVGFHRFQVLYWMSFAMQRGFELFGGRIASSSEHILNLTPIEDGLKHRPRSEWSIVYMNCELNDSEIWLKSALQQETGKDHVSLRQPVEKCYCLSVGKVSYGRETILPKRGELLASDMRNTPAHRLVVYDLKGAWTKSNRDVAFALFDTFVKTKQLKKNLSNESLKGFRVENNSTPMKSRNRPSEGPVTPPIQGSTIVSSNNSNKETESDTSAPSPLTKLQSGHAATMLQQLIAEADNKAVVFSDDLSVQTREQHLQGLAACQEDDVLHKNWLIVLINSQVLLKGCETKGYVILSAAKAEILQRVHRPVWKDRTLVSKTTWVGSLECMQYYATVSAGETDTLDENIMWLTVENIQEKDSTVIADVPDLPHLVGSGQSVGGVVSETVGASSQGDNPTVQLQRIVSRCKCEFFYAGYGESSIDPGTLAEVPPPPNDEAGIWEKPERAVDAFTLMHHDLDVCTNSLQYAMILDIVNNLLLYVEPRRKEASERLQRMRFQLQLYSIEDQRRPIQQLQNQVRSLLSKLRRLEKDTYLLQRILIDEPGNEEYLRKMEDLEYRVYECKEHLNSQSEELDMMLSCYKETQLLANQRMATLRGDKPLQTVRANEICFKHAQWRLTEADGQLGIADLVLSNFLYTKKSKSDDSGEHLLELGYVRMTNLLPNQIYKEVLCPTEIQSNMPVDRKKAVRVFCREKAPVGGISVKEHFEINVVPITIGLTKKFYNTMLKFCFPERDPETIDIDSTDDLEGEGSSKGKRTKTNRKIKETNFYVPIEHKDDVEKMKERAEKNKLFIYIKIPEVPVRVSYKGNKEKNLEDIRDFSLVIPTLEYHNVTWTWLDLLMAMKTDTRRVILSQAIKQKLQIKMNRGSAEEGASPQEEDKARMLFGTRHMPGDSRSLKKGMFKFQK